MDDIQKVLVQAGRKDLAQEYYKKVAAVDDIEVKTYEVYRDNWNVGNLFNKSDAKKMVNFFNSLNHAGPRNFEPNMKITEGTIYLTEKQLENLKRRGIKVETLEK